MTQSFDYTMRLHWYDPDAGTFTDYFAHITVTYEPSVDGVGEGASDPFHVAVSSTINVTLNGIDFIGQPGIITDEIGGWIYNGSHPIIGGYDGYSFSPWSVGETIPFGVDVTPMEGRFGVYAAYHNEFGSGLADYTPEVPWFGHGTGLHFISAAPAIVEPPPPPPPPPVRSRTTVGTLGCGEYRVLVTDRCGGRTVCELTSSAITYDLLKDDTSEAVVVVNAGGECCECLGDVRTWMHSMEIYRDGDLVWGPGPIYNLLYRRNTVTVTARDVSAWLDVRTVHNEYTKAQGTAFVQQPIDYIVRTILTDALSGGPDTPDDPCGLVRYLDVGPIPAVMDKEASVGDGYAGDILRDLARNVLDYTVVGNRIIVREQLSFGPYTRLTDEDFQTELEVEERGAEAGSKWYVNGNGVFGSCGGEPEDIQFIGLVEQVDSEDQITDEAAVKAAACSRHRASNPAPLYVNVPDGAKLSPSAPVTMKQLIPGTLIDISLREMCRAVTVRQRLTAVHVTVTNGDEAVGITLSPLGTGFGEAGGAVSRPLVR